MDYEEDTNFAISSFLQFGVTTNGPNLFYIRVTDINDRQIRIPYLDRNCTISTLLKTYLSITSKVNRSSSKKGFVIGNGPFSSELAPLDQKLGNLELDDGEICFLVREYKEQEMEQSIDNIKSWRESNGWMDITVNVFGCNVSFNVKCQWSLKEFKKRIIDNLKELKNMEQQWIKIQYNGLFLTNENQKIQNYKISRNETIVVIVNTPRNRQMHQNSKLNNITINIKFNNEDCGKLQIDPKNNTIMKIKQFIAVKYYINPYNLILIFGGKQLKNHQMINYYNIVHQSIIYLLFKKSQQSNYIHPDTLILLSSGQAKPISQIKQLDQIQTIDSRTHKLSKSSVARIQSKIVKDYLVINLDNYQKELKTSGDAFVELINGEVINLKQKCYQNRYQSEYKYYLKKVSVKQNDCYKIKEMAHHEMASGIKFYRLFLLKDHNYVADGVVVHRQYVNIGKLGAFNSIQKYITLPIYNQLDVLKLKKKIGQLYQINWKEIKLYFESQNLQDDIKLCQINLKSQHLILMKVMGEIEKVDSKLMMKSLSAQAKYIYLQVNKDKKIQLQFQKYQFKKIQDIMEQVYPHYKSSYFFSFAELILFPTDVLNNLTKSKHFQQQQIKIVLIKCDKFAFVKKMNVQAKDIKNHSYLIEQQQKLNSISSVSSSHLTSTDTLSNVSSQNQNYNQSMLSNQSNQSGKSSYQKSFKKLFYKHSSGKYQKQIQYIIKNCQDLENIRKNVKDFEQVYGFIKELYVKMNLLQNYIGKCYVGLKNFKFSQFYKKGNTFYWHSFTSASKNDINIRNNLKEHSGTLFHINSLTGKQIQRYSRYPQQKQILFQPFSYYLVEKVIQNQNMDEVWLSEIPSPITFEKGIILWVDDKSKGNQTYINQILAQRQHSIQILQVTSTLLAEKWIQQFGWLLSWKNIEFKLISDMTRQEQNQEGEIFNNFEAGIDLLQTLYKTHGVTAFTLIFCGNKQNAEWSIQQRNINQKIYYKVTVNQSDLKEFCKMMPK